MSRMLAIALACVLVLPVSAQDTSLSKAQEARYQVLIEELRCLVCQNQNIAESNAPLAEDLREQVAEMIKAGRSDAEIKKYLTDRYGDFVLYRPPLKASTWLLWFSPFLLLALGLFIALRVYASRRQASEVELDKQAISALLKDDNQQEPRP